MNCKAILLSIFLLFQAVFSISQPINQTPFVPPLDIPLYLSGTFGELRSNHFHSGIDIKTQGREGLRVKSIEDGWVSRIKISAGGYGKAIYITHNNGYVSVYGHLKCFNDTIEQYIKALQYKQESFEVEAFPDKNELSVKKGQIIAFSGNTGGSMGPHLHFEIREEATQHPVNPLLFNSLKVKDFYRPKILEMAIYPADQNAFVNGKQDTLFIPVAGWGVTHRLDFQSQIKLQGNISFGLLTYDLMNDIPNKNGVFEVLFFNDTTQVFGFTQDKLSFATTRYINSLIDFEAFTATNKRFVRTQIDTNNLFRNYTQVEGNGIFQFNDSLQHQFSWRVSDVYGNLSKLDFTVWGDTAQYIPVKTLSETPYFVHFSSPLNIQTSKAEILIPANATYKSFYFDYQELITDTTQYSTTVKIHQPKIPLQKSVSLKLKVDNLPLKLENAKKLYLAYSEDNKSFAYAGGALNDGWIESSIRRFGYYKVIIDTICPTIRVNKIKPAAKGEKNQILSAKISDKQTGISAFRATLNNSWLLMEYDAKNNLIFYTSDEKIKAGKNTFHLEITDGVGNKTVYDEVIESVNGSIISINPK